MCLAIPARIIEILADESAKAEVGGIVKDVSLALVDDVGVGDYVVVHVGFALSKLEPEEAEATLQLFAEAGVLTGADAMVEVAEADEPGHVGEEISGEIPGTVRAEGARDLTKQKGRPR